MNQLFAKAPEYNYGYEVASQTTSGDATAAFISDMLIIGMILTAFGYLVTSFLLGKIFGKAGISSWKAWVPVYNTWNVLQLGGQKGYWAIVGLFPVIQIAGVVFLFITMHKIGGKFNKPKWFTLLAIFAPIVWMIWLAYDTSKWQVKPTKLTPRKRYALIKKQHSDE